MRTTITILLIFLGIDALTQDTISSIKSITLGLGITHQSLQDKVFSPLVYRGSALSTNLGYQSQSIKQTHSVFLHFSNQSLYPIQDDINATIVQNTIFSLDYEYSRVISLGENNYNLGLGFYNFGAVKSYDFRQNEDSGLDFFSSLNFFASVSRTYDSKHKFQFSISYPVLSYVAGKMRVPLDFPPEVLQAVIDDPNDFPIGSYLTSGEFHSIMDFIDFRSKFKYYYDISKHWDIGFEYQFRYYNYPKFLTVQSGASQLSLLITYVF